MMSFGSSAVTAAALTTFIAVARSYPERLGKYWP